MKVCSVEGCDGPLIGNGYCRKHYLKYRKYGNPLHGYEQHKNVDGKCKIEECAELHYCRGYCKNHYVRPSEKNLKCSIDGCEGKYKGGGYCGKHQQRSRKHGDPLKSLLNRENDGTCSLEGCEEKYHSKGYCSKHFYVGREKCSVEGCESNQKCSGYCRKHSLKFWSKSETGASLTRAAGHRRRSLKTNAVVNDLTAKDWRKSYKHFNSECAYCGNTGKKIHADHVVPLSKGGSNTVTNIIPACETCNCSKGTKLIEKWYPKQSFYSKQRESKIYKWMGYKVYEDALQATLF